jgi:GDP-L-fucose synthase
MKILLTGGSGFIGRNLKEFLLEYDIYAPNRLELDLLKEGVVQQYLYENKFDTIIHCANYDAVNPNLKNDKHFILSNNLRMFFNIAQCQETFGKLIYLGSGAELNTDFNETSIIPQQQYSLSKRIISRYIQDSKSDILQLRLFGVYGKYEDTRTRFISNACCRCIKNLPIIINQNRFIDYIHIDDLCNIIKLFLTTEYECKTYDIVDQPTDLLTIAKTIRNIDTNKSSIYINKSGSDTEYISDNTNFKQEFDYQFLSLTDGIQNLYNWYSNHREAIIF